MISFGKAEATRRIVHTLRKPTTLPTKLAFECDLVLGRDWDGVGEHLIDFQYFGAVNFPFL
jgi:hypothetical protein